jgi:hypothetical protein
VSSNAGSGVGLTQRLQIHAIKVLPATTTYAGVRYFELAAERADILSEDIERDVARSLDCCDPRLRHTNPISERSRAVVEKV